MKNGGRREITWIYGSQIEKIKYQNQHAVPIFRWWDNGIFMTPMAYPKTLWLKRCANKEIQHGKSTCLSGQHSSKMLLTCSSTLTAPVETKARSARCWKSRDRGWYLQDLCKAKWNLACQWSAGEQRLPYMRVSSNGGSPKRVSILKWSNLGWLILDTLMV